MKVEPRATYRTQLYADFNFDAVADIVAYLAELGISHLYSAPCLQAAPRSTHGYDVVDYSVSSDLGGEIGRQRLCAALRASAMGMILDIVPNHMAITGPENPWWWDVLENGPASRYSTYFDVDWEPPEARLRNSVLLPVLGDHYGRELDAGRIELIRRGAEFLFRYYERIFPVAPRSLDTLLSRTAERCGLDELGFIADSLGCLPIATEVVQYNLRRRERDITVLKDALARLLRSSADATRALDQTVAEFNHDHELLHSMLERQNYRLAFWRSADRDLGYRRFFDINNLVGLRMENDQVFNDTHRMILHWLDEGTLDGVRIDHIDGLRDPYGYLERLHKATPDVWIVVEKVLQPAERLRESWPVAGTTGYDFLNRVLRLLIDPEAEEPLTRLYADFAGVSADYPTVARQCKEMIARGLLGSELNRLTELFIEVCERDRRHRDYTRHELHEALVAMVTELPVYRTYCREGAPEPHPDDLCYIDQATASAKANRPDLDTELLDFLRRLLLQQEPGLFQHRLALGFQQYTGPVMAKAVEDTAFYRYHRLVCLNEVGGDPSQFGLSPGEFHRSCIEVQRHWPQTMLSTSTHDTKRSGDVRARLAVLSEIHESWAEVVHRWSAKNAPHWSGAPDRNTEYLFYQTVVGAWPIPVERVWPYMEKAMREAKLETSWSKVNEVYERRIQCFVEEAMKDHSFINDVEAFVSKLEPYARNNSLAQTLLKLSTPGVPDFYQGTELCDFSLVDPDNRRPVDYDLRRRLLGQVRRMTADNIVAFNNADLYKFWLIQRVLAVRTRVDLFGPKADYQPLGIDGPCAAHAIGFMRGSGAVVIVPRLTFRLAGRWRDTALDLPRGQWRSQLTDQSFDGGRVPLERLLEKFPVALLIREE